MSKEAKWQEVYKVQTAAITELEQRIAELEAELEQCLDCCKRAGELEAERDRLDALAKDMMPGPVNGVNSDPCIHPDCECLDYCEAADPYSKTPVRHRESKELEEALDWYQSDEWRIGRM